MDRYIVLSNYDFRVFSENIKDDPDIIEVEFLEQLGVAIVSTDNPNKLSSYGVYTKDFAISLEDFDNTPTTDAIYNIEPEEIYKQWNYEMINLEEAHKTGALGQDVKIAILDTGADDSHELLHGHIAYKYNAIEDNDNITDEYGHGTATAGIVATTAPYAELYIIKVFGQGKHTTMFSTTLKGLEIALEQGVNIINCSFGRYGSQNDVEKKLYEKLYDNNIAVVCSAGNWGTDRYEHYPSGYEWNISVGSVNKERIRSNFSCYGEKVGLNIMAPGEDILLAKAGGGYRTGSGTSFSAPHVTGISALIKSIQRNIDTDRIKEIIQISADKNIQNYNKHEYGYGILDAEKSIEIAQNNGILYSTDNEPLPILSYC